MSLATYLKKDIDAFLEEMQDQTGKASPVREEEFALFTIEKDYAGLTNQAFDNNDTNSIEKMLKELQKQSTNELLEKDLREKITAVLSEVEEIILRRITEVDSVSLHAEAQKIIADRKRRSITEQERNTMFKKEIVAINSFISKGQVEQAKLAYQRLVKDFKTYSDGPEKEEWRRRIFSVFESIKMVQEKLLKQKALLNEKQNMQIESIKQKISLVIGGLGSIDPIVLENKMLEIKQDIIAAHMSKEQGEAFLPILRTLVSKINFLKQMKDKEFLLGEKKKKEEEDISRKRIEAELILADEDMDEVASDEELAKEDAVSLTEEEIKAYEKALLLQKKGELAKAKKIYMKLLKINPRNIRAEIRLKEILAMKKN